MVSKFHMEARNIDSKVVLSLRLAINVTFLIDVRYFSHDFWYNIVTMQGFM